MNKRIIATALLLVAIFVSSCKTQSCPGVPEPGKSNFKRSSHY
jgi:hypothetical protein